MIGQCYDGAASMKGSFKCVQARIREHFPDALHVHCSSYSKFYSLNLALGYSCEVVNTRNCIETVKAVANFKKLSKHQMENFNCYVRNKMGRSPRQPL